MSHIWKVSSLESNNTETLNNVVHRIVWLCFKQQDGIEVSKRGSTSIEPPTNAFTNYEDLTEEQVLEWLFNTELDKESVETAVDKKYDRIFQQEATPSIPWNNPVAEAA